MDVNALYDRAMSMWQEMSHQEPEDAPEDVARDADETDVSATVADVSSDEPVEVPSNEELPSDPVEIMQDAELTNDQQDSQDEQSLLPEMTPADPLDAMAEQDSYEQQAEPDLPFDPQSFPADPLDAMEEASLPPDPSLSIEQAQMASDSDLSTDTADMPSDSPLTDEQNLESPRRSTSQDGRETTVNVNMPDGWEANISDTIQQRMRETQELVNAHVDDEIGRSQYHLDLMGSD